MKLRLVFLALLLQTMPTHAQTYAVERHFDITNGLSNNLVIDMAIDKHGAVWVATESGLNRIVGRTCTTFDTPDFDGRTEPIKALYYDAGTDKLFISTPKVLGVYECATGKVMHLTTKDGLASTDIPCITEAGEGKLWIIHTEGIVQQMDAKTHSLYTLPCNIKDLRTGRDDGKGQLYLGHQLRDGLTIVDLKTKHARNLRHQYGDEKSLPGNNVRCIYKDRHDNIWVGTNMGLALFDPKTETFRRVSHARRGAGDNVFNLLDIGDGYLWVASDMGGISFVRNSQIPEAGPLLYDEQRQAQLTSNNTRSMACDNFGNLWVGNHSTGVDFIPTEEPLFRTLRYYDQNKEPIRTYGITSDRHGNLWLGGENEICRIGQDHEVHRWRIDGIISHPQSFVHCMMADSQDCIWLGVEDEGAFRFHPATGQFEYMDIGHPASDIRSFYEDRDGTIWIGSEYGMYTWKDGKISRPTAVNKALNYAVVFGMKQISQRMAMGTNAYGLYIFDGNGKFIRIGEKDGLPSSNVNCLHQDGATGLWLGTGKGLAYIKDINHPRSIETYGKRQGLRDEYICAIQKDEAGNLWLSTYSGMAKFDTRKKRFYHFGRQSNLPSGCYVTGASTVLPDGTLCFGSLAGIGCFQPRQMKDNARVSEAVIASCEVYGTTASETTETLVFPCNRGEIHTDYQQNSFRLTFTVKNLAQAGDVEYAYMVKGLSDKWFELGDENEVTFRGLSPGRYVFVVRAKLRGQDWNEASTAELAIRIAPPFWRTWWAYLVYAALAAALVCLLLKNYKRRLFLRNSLEMERRENLQKQELNEERLRFFTNITHELRTPLTLILGPLEDLMNDRRMPELYHRKVELINKSAGRLRNLVNEILEFRKTETQNRRLTVAKGDLGTLVTEIGENYKQLNRNPKTAISVTVQPDLPPVYFDSEVITTVLNNFLSNAVKYTPEGHISVTLSADGKGHVNLAVQDTGYGIRKEALPHIFDRYYQTDGKHQAEGTGIGLALVKSLADLHEATLTVESEEGRGSTFTFSLLTDNSYPGALHKEDKAEENTERDGDSTADEAQTDTDELPLLLVVEDNDDIRQYIAESMGEDFRVIQAADGREGTALAMEQVPDIIVSDIMMPRMNGIELTRRVKEDIRTCHIPVILLTAKDSVEDKEEGYDCGADSYLTKPFSARLLQSRIQNLLSSRRRLAELTVFRQSGTQELAELTVFRQSGTQETPPPETDEPTLNRLDREFLDKMNRIIEEHITTEDLNMDFMSDKMAMSYSTFYRKVKALTGMTAKEYILKRRLYHCAKLLQSGDYNVTEAATMTGFNDQNNFRIVFKKEFGVTPSAYKSLKNV